MLAERYPASFLEGALLPREQWQPFPPASDRAAWERLQAHPLNQRRRAYVVAQAEAHGTQPWPALPATLFLDFALTGNRVRFEQPYFARRTRLGFLVLAECFEGKGRWRDAIVDGLWYIQDESTWCLPAHTGGDALPRPGQSYVDLFACETAAVLGECLYLLGDALSDPVTERLRHEVLARVVVPVETREDINWFDGYNNWTPWCAANTLGAAMCVVDDTARLARLAHRLMGCVDRFLAHYEPDGGCDEGPSYWGVAAGALLLFLEHLFARTDGQASVYQEPLIANMGRFMPAAHLDGLWFFNMGDGGARSESIRPILWRYGERTGDADILALAGTLARGGRPEGAIVPPLQSGHTGATLTYGLRELFWMPADEAPVRWRKPVDTWLPNLEVMTARERPEPGRGLVLSAKAGHNHASHNHNDVGQFVLWYDGQPVIIDLGVESYSRKTFSPERYTLWTIRASGHNLPLVNGHEQQAGPTFAATDVRHAADESAAELRMNLRQAYAPEAGIESLERTVRLVRGPAYRVELVDEFRLRAGPAVLAIPMYTPAVVTVEGPGVVRYALEAGTVHMRFDPAVLTVAFEPVAITDPGLRHSWPEQLTRVTLRCSTPHAHGRYAVSFLRG